MMYQPNHLEALAASRVAELRRETAALRSADPGKRPLSIEDRRRNAGWLLVSIGLRLAVPRRERRTLTTNS
jgi:hypothetical protein